jgi:hypothetical protein
MFTAVAWKIMMVFNNRANLASYFIKSKSHYFKDYLMTKVSLLLR